MYRYKMTRLNFAYFVKPVPCAERGAMIVVKAQRFDL